MTSSIGSYGGAEDEQLGRERVKDFFFDYSYWSYDETSPNFTTQSMVRKKKRYFSVVA